MAFCFVDFVSQFMADKFLLLYGDLFVTLAYFCEIIMRFQNKWNLPFTADLERTLDCEDFKSNKIMFCLQISPLIF